MLNQLAAGSAISMGMERLRFAAFVKENHRSAEGGGGLIQAFAKGGSVELAGRTSNTTSQSTHHSLLKRKSPSSKS